MSSEIKSLPYICPDHPNAKIRHEWDQERFVYSDGYPRGQPLSLNHRYYCNDCGRELCAPEEAPRNG